MTAPSGKKRRLIVLRHAKSSWKSGAGTDHERPLNGRGRKDAPRIAAALVERGWRPDLILSSTARRTRETVDRMREVFGPVPERYEPGLYLAGPAALEPLFEAVPGDVETLLVVGHNPGCEEMVQWLCGAREELTTGNAVLLEGEPGSWNEALRQPWRLCEVIRPREL